MKRRPLYVKLTIEERARLDRLAACRSADAGRPINISDTIRQLIAEAPLHRPDTAK